MGELWVIAKHPRNVREIVMRSIQSGDGRRERRDGRDIVVRSIKSGDGRREKRDAMCW